MIGLNFHGIGCPERDLEPGEAPYWISEKQFIDILDRVQNCVDPKRYVITFDDGNLSDHRIALPALVARGLAARFFVLAGRLGKVGSLNVPDVLELQASGMRIGSHGYAHVPWAGLKGEDLAQEIVRSREILEEICNQPVKEAGIPFGKYDAQVLKALRRAGYSCAYSSDLGPMNCADFLRPRTSIRDDMTTADIDEILAGTLPLRQRIRRTLSMAKRRYFPLF
ncbi:polysaccharide deacetylase family protein [Pseudohalocynthiibacter sp. F2068]|uniref:polysaccharide deacetylase family protein n=1 Tax=Pseudohalocynthiibacter sp. F2068 TaxID=2926418 RepID=UPI001FF2586C|nr:polysaccharide deacetylase family protein [Pseudohalocynthiibacter sp. F2068]